MKTFSSETLLKIILFCLLAVLVVAIVILASVPPVSRDALTHHLAVPKLYLQHGSLCEIPSVAFSYYPMNLDLLYIIPLYFGNDIIPKFIHFVFALLTAWLVYSYLEKKLGLLWALLGTLFFLSLPIIVKLSITVYVDLGLAFFSTASIISLLKWVESRFRIKYLILSGICCGMALGTKYNGLIVFFLLSVFVPFLYINQIKKNIAGKEQRHKVDFTKYQLKAIWSGMTYCMIALVVFSPWMIRNYVWKGNPIYPLYHNLINPPKSISNDTLNNTSRSRGTNSELQQTTPAKSTPWSSFAIRKVIYGEAWWEVAIIPLRIFFQGQDDNPKYFDGKLSPFLFFLPFFAFFQLKYDPPALRTEKTIFASFTSLYILYAFFQTDMRIRYIAPIIPPLAILSIFGMYKLAAVTIYRWTKPASRFLAGGILLLAICMLSFNASYILKQFKYVDPFSYLAGAADRDAYIARYRPEYWAIQYANRNLSDNAKILALFLGNRRYYSDRELVPGNNLFRKSLKTAESSDMMTAEMQRNGFTHLLIRYDLFNSWSDVQFDDSEKGVLKRFFENHLTTLFSKSGYGLYRIKTGI